MFDGVPPYRTLVLDDLPWCLSLGHRRYGSYDPGGALSFLAAAFRAPLMLCIRTDNAFLVASSVTAPWRPKEPECHVMVLCAEQGAHWEAARLLRRSVAWAREQGCVRWRFHSETSNMVDSLCVWVGAKQDSPRWVLDL
jgi:hypothetical protein